MEELKRLTETDLLMIPQSRVDWKDAKLRPWHSAQSYGEIFAMRADGTDVRQLTDNQWSDGVVGWAPSASEATGLANPPGQDR